MVSPASRSGIYYPSKWVQAFEKRPISEENFKKLINRIERNIQLKKKTEMVSKEIGEIIIKELRRSDPVAYIRFTSVYQDFKDVSQFLNVINKVFKSGTTRKSKAKK